MKHAVLLALVFTCIPAFAKDHSSEYQVGVFSSTGQLSDGTLALCNGAACSSASQLHNVHYVRTDGGMYMIEAPISIAGSVFASMATNGMSSDIHKQWFMDQLHEGDKVLFASRCNKHNNCTFWVPDPDRTGKEFETQGYYQPDHAKTNTQTLCGKGKLRPEVEAQVCGPAPMSPISPSPVVASAPTAQSGFVAQIKENSLAGKDSEAARAAGSSTPEQLAQIVKDGTASKCLVKTSPAGAMLYVDGKQAGKTPMMFVLVQHPDQPRVLTVKLDGYMPAEKQVSPDGKDVVIDLTLIATPPQ